MRAVDTPMDEATSSPRKAEESFEQVDVFMLEDSLSMTPWERILANDDMVNFGDSLREAMEKRNAKSR